MDVLPGRQIEQEVLDMLEARSPADGLESPLAVHPELIGRILYDPLEPATEEDWPSSAR